MWFLFKVSRLPVGLNVIPIRITRTRNAIQISKNTINITGRLTKMNRHQYESKKEV